MNAQRILLAAFSFFTIVAVSGCVVHEHDDHWDHHHDKEVIIEHH